MRSKVWDIILSNGNCLDSGNVSIFKVVWGVRGTWIRGFKYQISEIIISIYFDERLVNALFGFHLTFC